MSRQPLGNNSRHDKTSTETEKVNDDMDSFEFVEVHPLMERLQHVLSLVGPAKKEIQQVQTTLSLTTGLNQQLTGSTKNTAHLKQELEQAKQEIEILKRQAQKNETSPEAADVRYTARIKSLELEVRNLKNEKAELQQTLNYEKQAYEDVIKIHKQKIQSQSEEQDVLQAEMRKALRENQEAMSNLSREKENEIAVISSELSNTKSRISKLMGDKLSKQNPDIADLSDENRPTKIAEKFSELYDNQWTDAFEAVEKLHPGKTEDQRVKILIQLLMDVNKFCQEEFRSQEETFTNALHGTVVRTKDPPVDVLQHVRDYWKTYAEECTTAITEKYLNRADTRLSLKRLANNIRSFTLECVRICWLMVHQDPPLVFHLNVLQGDTFDGSLYKAYTKSGKMVDFVVWPALLLHAGGPILAKGIVQCIKMDQTNIVNAGKSSLDAADIMSKDFKHLQGSDQTFNANVRAPDANVQDLYSKDKTVMGMLFQSQQTQEQKDEREQLNIPSPNDTVGSNILKATNYQYNNIEKSEMTEHKNLDVTSPTEQPAVSANSKSDEYNIGSFGDRSDMNSCSKSDQYYTQTGHADQETSSDELTSAQIESQLQQVTAHQSVSLSEQFAYGTSQQPSSQQSINKRNQNQIVGIIQQHLPQHYGTLKPKKHEWNWFVWYNKQQMDESEAKRRMDNMFGEGSYERCIHYSNSLSVSQML